MKDERNWENLVRTNFDFGWSPTPTYIKLTLEYQKGSILDVGCATCKLYSYLKSKGWKEEYIGIDNQKHESYKYPREVEIIIGDALEAQFPKVDTVILYNILEHVDSPITLLSKSIRTARENVLIYVPKRNEDLWKFGIVEHHQLDKSHKHCGLSKEEVYKLVDLSGGIIKTYKELGKIDATVGVGLWKSRIARVIVYILSKIFPSKIFYREIWCEVVAK